jgi:hypothetical protein
MKLALDRVEGRLRYWRDEPPGSATGSFVSRSARITQDLPVPNLAKIRLSREAHWFAAKQQYRYYIAWA